MAQDVAKDASDALMEMSLPELKQHAQEMGITEAWSGKNSHSSKNNYYYKVLPMLLPPQRPPPLASAITPTSHPAPRAGTSDCDEDSCDCGCHCHCHRHFQETGLLLPQQRQRVLLSTTTLFNCGFVWPTLKTPGALQAGQGLDM